jgi:flavin-dependent dehydrogenase
MTMRAQLDGALIDAAVRAGAELRAPCAFRGIEASADGVRIATDAGPLTARVAIAGDGALSPVARAAGLPDAPAPIPALEAEVRVSDAVRRRFDAPRFDFGTIDRGYAWVFPKHRHLSVGVLSTRRGRVALHEELERYLAHVGIEPAEVEGVERHGFVIPVAPRSVLARDGVLCVGDAAGLADPVTCEGISWALESGRLAARAFVEHGPSPAAVTRAYVRALRSRVLPELATARLLADVLYRRPRAARFLFRRHGRALCEAMTDVVLGRSTCRSLVRDPRSWLRLLGAAPRLHTGPRTPTDTPAGAQTDVRT